MKKKSVLIVLLIALVFLTACDKKEEVKNKTPEEIKSIMEKEKDFTSGNNVHQEFINVKDFKKKDLDIKWVEKTKTINIKGNMIVGYEVNSNIELYDESDSYVLSEDGTLYRNHKGNYSVMKPDDKISRIGIYYPNHGGSNNCHGNSIYVIETEKGIQYFEKNEETGSVSIKKLDVGKYFIMPVCYGVPESKLMDNVVVYDDGRIVVDDKDIKDKATKETLDAKYVIYAEKEDKEKYYVITTDDKLYIIDDVSEYYELIGKVEVKVTPSPDSEEGLDVDIEIKYDDVTMKLVNVVNQS